MRLFWIFVILSIIGSVSAGTVTLTGSCKAAVVNNTLNFSLSNSGNESAFDVIVDPYISQAQVIGNYSAHLLSPGSTLNFSIKLANVTARGTYVDYIIVAYQQGSSFFSAFFPCWLEFQVPATPQLFIAATPFYKNKSIELVNVTLMNAGTKTVLANVSMLLPPEVHAIGKSSYQLKLAPANITHLQFGISIQNLFGATLNGAVYASYYQNNISYSTPPVVFLVAPMPVKHYLSGSLFFYGIIIVIILFGLFVLFTALKNKRKKQNQAQVGV